jgi:hypothetical protein
MSHNYENTGKIPFRQMLKSVREELEAAVEEVMNRGRQKVYFDIENVEIELKVEAQYKGGVTGGFEFFAVHLGTNVEKASTTAHTFKFTLKPKNASGGKLQVSDESEERPE